MAKKALYLAGGGARGAYQAGALKAIAQILQVKTLPFEAISGVSIGSINAAVLAQYAHDFPKGTEVLETLWREIRCHNIFNTSNYELSKSVLRNLGNLLIKQRQSGYLLDTTPLHRFIQDNIQFDKIHANISAGRLEAMEVITNCYEAQQTISFYQHHQPSFDDWIYPRHASQPAQITMEHLLASSALPLFFPTVKIGNLHYGDGGMGLVSPLRGALRFNAEKILVIGTRQPPGFPSLEAPHSGTIGFAQILGSMLNGLFLDNLDRDIEMVNKMNDIARLLSLWKKRYSPWRPVETLHLRPSQNMAKMAQEQYLTMPTLLRTLLNVLGAQRQSGDLLSFLLFESGFTNQLIDLGYNDTIASTEAVLAFFTSSAK